MRGLKASLSIEAVPTSAEWSDEALAEWRSCTGRLFQATPLGKLRNWRRTLVQGQGVEPQTLKHPPDDERLFTHQLKSVDFVLGLSLKILLP